MKTIILLICLTAVCSALIAQDTETSQSVSTTNQKNKPLFIVDGIKLVVTDSIQHTHSLTLEDIKPEDIGRIEVLKDKNAIEKYGDAGKYGVVLIFTKDPKKYRKQ